MIVTNAFVEKKLHDYNPLVPSLMMNGNWVVISLYDCVQDYLLITTKIDLYEETGHLCSTIYMVIH